MGFQNEGNIFPKDMKWDSAFLQHTTILFHERFDIIVDDRTWSGDVGNGNRDLVSFQQFLCQIIQKAKLFCK